MKRALLAVLGWILSQGILFADFDELERRGSILWDQAALVLELEAGVDPRTPLAPGTRFQAENRIESALPSLYLEAVGEIPVDSYETVGQRVRASDALYRALSDLAVSGARKEASSFSKDLHRVVVQYRFPFYGTDGLIAPFILHELPFPIRRILGFTPSRSFTGLVILAQGDFPAHGKSGRERVRAALLPKLFDERMEPVLAPENCDPQFLVRWGMAAYAYSGDEATLKAHRDRIGDLPLLTMARGVFGRNSTDILLPEEAVRQLLSREANRALLREGRILIILDRP